MRRLFSSILFPRTDFKFRQASHSAEQPSNDSRRDQRKIQFHNRMDKRRREGAAQAFVRALRYGDSLLSKLRKCGSLLCSIGALTQPMQVREIPDPVEEHSD
jgi:hypothetical protein